MTGRQFIFAALLAMLIALAGTNAAVAQDPATAEATLATPVTFDVTGAAASGTADVTIPANVPVTLNVVHFYSDRNPDVFTYEAILDAEYKFAFPGITAFPGDSIFVTTQYEGILQGSTPITVQVDQSAVALTLTLYGGTNDPNVITLVAAQHVLGINQGNVLEVVATYSYKNNSDRYFLSIKQTANGKPVSIEVPLPVAAQPAFSLVSGSRFEVGGNEALPIVQDTKPVLPGQTHEVAFSYQLPFTRGAQIDTDFPYNTEAVSILIPADSELRVAGDFNVTTTTVGSAERQYVQYAIKEPMKAGGRLIYTIEEKALQPTPAPAQSSTTSAGASIGILIILMGVIVLAGVIGLAMIARATTRR
jgi:hypothetical protein